jgi:hypothetical protein
MVFSRMQDFKEADKKAKMTQKAIAKNTNKKLMKNKVAYGWKASATSLQGLGDMGRCGLGAAVNFSARLFVLIPLFSIITCVRLPQPPLWTGRRRTGSRSR